jgi:cystathionine beta-synthase
MYAAIRGYKCIFVMADKQSQEKVDNLRAFGAEVIMCPTHVEADDPRSYYSVSRKLSQTLPNSYYVSQYDNPLNPETHYLTTGPEIWQQTNGSFCGLVCGVGTGGTISGTGKYLKEKNPHVKIIGVDIKGSILTHFHQYQEIIPAESYVLEGIGEDFIPKNVDFSVIDEFVMVEDLESFIMTRNLLKKEALYVGGSSGAAVIGAIRYAQKYPETKRLLVILPDSGNRYAKKIYNDEWMISLYGKNALDL